MSGVNAMKIYAIETLPDKNNEILHQKIFDLIVDLQNLNIDIPPELIDLIDIHDINFAHRNGFLEEIYDDLKITQINEGDYVIIAKNGDIELDIKALVEDDIITVVIRNN